MTNRIVPWLSFGKKLALSVAGIAALATPIVIGMMNAPSLRAQSGVAATAQEFEVASLRANVSGTETFSIAPPSGGRFTGTNLTLGPVEVLFIDHVERPSEN